MWTNRILSLLQTWLDGRDPTSTNKPPLTAAQLRLIYPHASEDTVLRYWPLLLSAMHQYGIDQTPARVAAFVAQIGHECGELKYFTEFASGESYEGRKDLGNTEPGDGPRFKGRGAIQITGRANYTAVSKALGVDFVATPELLAAPKYALLSAAWWWAKHGLNALADAGDFDRITKIINGGLHGKKQRDAYHAKALEVLAARAYP